MYDLASMGDVSSQMNEDREDGIDELAPEGMPPTRVPSALSDSGGGGGGGSARRSGRVKPARKSQPPPKVAALDGAATGLGGPAAAPPFSSPSDTSTRRSLRKSLRKSMRSRSNATTNEAMSDEERRAEKLRRRRTRPLKLIYECEFLNFVYSVALSNDGATCAISGTAGEVWVMDILRRKRLHKIALTDVSRVQKVAFSGE